MMKMSESEFRDYSVTGSLFSVMLKVGLPLAVFQLLQSCFNLLDAVMASHVSKTAVSAVAYLSQLQLVFSAIGAGLVAGSMIEINKAYGAGGYDLAKRRCNVLFTLLLVVSVLILLTIPFIRPFLLFIGTPVELVETGSEYFSVFLVATALNFFNLLYVSIEKSRGNTRLIMWLNLAETVLKLSLTALFVYVFDGGIVTIAIATLITYSVLFLYACPKLFFKDSFFKLERKYMSLNGALSVPMLRISLPIIVEKSAFSMGKAVVNGMVAGYGATTIGALGVSNNITGLINNFHGGFHDAASAIISQNYGASEESRVIRAYWVNLVINVVASLIGMALIYALSRPLIHIFATSKVGYDPEFESLIALIFSYDLFSCVGLAFNGAGIGFLMGIGKTKAVLAISMSRIFLYRIPILWFFQNFTGLGVVGVGVMMALSNLLAGVTATAFSLYYIHAIRKEGIRQP